MKSKAFRSQVARREVIKGALKAGAYAAPVIAVGAVPFAVGAVTGAGGVTLLINGGNSATLAYGASFTLTGRGYTPGATLYRVASRNFAGTGAQYSFLPLTVSASGTITDTELTTNVGAFSTNGPGNYTISIATMANTSTFSGVLVSVPVTLTTGSVPFAVAAPGSGSVGVQD